MNLPHKSGIGPPASISFCAKLMFVIFFLTLFLRLAFTFAQTNSKVSELSQLNSFAQYSFGTLVVCGNDGFILRTVNDGISWFQRPSGTTENLNSIDTYGRYMAGTSGIILQSNDAGTNWAEIQSGTSNELRSVSGYPVVAVGSEGTIVKLNEISNLFEVKTSGVSQTLNGVDFVDQQNGFAVGNNGTFITTSDGGESWNVVTSGTGNNLNSIRFVPFASMGWIVGDGGIILFTNDGGVTWNSQTSGTTENLYSISAPDFNGFDVLAVGSNGTVLKSTDGGANWTAQSSGVTETLRTVNNYSLDYIAGDNVTIVRSSDGGITWSLINNNITDVDTETQLRLSNFRLNQNYPNPFNPTTKISWQSPISSHQTLKIYDVLGNEVATLTDEYLPAGIYETEFSAEGLSSGIYFYKLLADNFVQTKKMMLLK